MATISNTPRPGYVWDSTDNVWYPIGVGGHGHTDYITQATAISPTTVDAKGDLLVGSAADTIARLAVGNSGEQLVADSSTSTGLRYIPYGSINYAINGGMDIWQRGTSFSVGAFGSAFTADRWWTFNAPASTISQETTTVPSGARYAMKMTANASGVLSIRQAIETSNTIPLANKQVTLSFFVTGTTGASATGLIRYSTSTDATVTTSGTAISPAAETSSGSLTSGTFTKVTVTATIPSTAKTLYIGLDTSTLSSTQNIIFGNVQLELGATATEFRRTGGSIQGELAACQRYYSKSYNQSAAPGSATFEGFQYSGVNAVGTTTGYLGAEVFWPVRMRIAPTLTTYDSTYTSGRVSRVTPAVNDQNGLTPTTAFNSESKCLVQSASGNAHSGIGFQWTASAEL